MDKKTDILNIIKKSGRCLTRPEVYTLYNEPGSLKSSMETLVKKGILVKARIKSSWGFVAVYGLLDWFNEDGTPKSEYLP